MAELRTAFEADGNDLVVRFQPGDLLRLKGLHYRDMYIVVDGTVEVDLGTGGPRSRLQITEDGNPVGEIGFLHGVPATASVTAVTETAAICIDDDVMSRLERDHPALAARLLQWLASLAAARTSFNLIVDRQSGRAKGQDIEVLLCRTPEMLERAQRLRYEVYCEELGRRSPHADHERRIIADDLDAFAQTFIALQDGEVIGTLRGNLPTQGPLGVLEEVYGMRSSPHHPRATSVCTKFVVKKSKRGGPAALKLIAAMVRYGVERGVKECYVDCVPRLVPYYKAMGFVPAGRRFMHRENGPSDPLKLDVVKYGKRLSGEMSLPAYLGIVAKAQLIRLTSRMPLPMLQRRMG